VRFSTCRDSFLSRRRRQNFEATLARLEERLGERYVAGSAASAGERLERLADRLSGQQLDAIDLRSLTLCWCDVYLPRFPIPERAEKALYRYARSLYIEAEDLELQLSDYCVDEFKRRCKNQYLASLDLGSAD
jgi:hypothetical protein